MVQCPYCGTQQENAAFCCNCGKPLETTTPTGSGFFSSLGGLDDLSAPAPAPKAAPRPETPPAAPASTVTPPPAKPESHSTAPTPPSAKPESHSTPTPPPAKPPVHPMRRISAGKELRLLLRQGLLILFGDKRNLLFSLLFPVIAGVFTVWIAGEYMFHNHEATKGGCFILVCAAIWCGLFNSIQSLVKERPNIKRDYVSGALRIECYMGSRTIIQVVLCAVQTLVLTISICGVEWYWGNSLPASGLIFDWVLLDFYVSLFLVMLASDAMGLMISAMVKKEELASKLAPYILIAQLLFSGMLFEMQGFAYSLSAIMISRWGMEALGSISGIYEQNTAMYNSLEGSIMPNPCACPAEHASSCVNYGQQMALQACECPVTQHSGMCSKGLLTELQFNTPGTGDPMPFEATNEHLVTVWLIMAAFVVVCLVGADLLLYRVKKDGRS